MLEFTEVTLSDLRYLLGAMDAANAELEVIAREGAIKWHIVEDMQSATAIVKEYLTHKE